LPRFNWWIFPTQTNTGRFQRARISIKAMPIIEIAEECRALIESAIESPTGRRHRHAREGGHPVIGGVSA
jgi:hypothetical protein